MIAATKSSLLKKSQSIVFTIAAIMISLGQWADTKDIITDSYEGFITHFTDKVELQKLSHVRVGANLSYLETVFGDARLIKTKNQTSQLQYRYYHTEKFLLALAVNQQRVVGYQLVSLQQDFMPPIAFSKQLLGQQALAEYQPFSGTFSTDTVNLRYYLEPITLGREGLFLDRHLGFVEYGAALAQYQQPLQQLNDLLLQAYDNSTLHQQTAEFRNTLIPNVYSLGEISLEQAADMLLTRYEYQAYFQPQE